MKIYKSALLLIAVLSACSPETPTHSPEAHKAFSEARDAVDKCLAHALADLIETTNDPTILARVAATRCEGTALQQEQRLRKTNINQNVVTGFVSMWTKPNLMDRAMNMDLSARKSAIAKTKAKKK